MKLNKIALFTVLCFIILSCAVDVNQPVEVEDNNTFSSKKIFNAIVNHIGWKVSNSRFSISQPTEGVSYVDLSILSIWEFTDDTTLDDAKGEYKLLVYIKDGQIAKIKDTTLSHAHQTGIEKRLYYSNGVFEIQSLGGNLTFVYYKEAAMNWDKLQEKFAEAAPGFGTGDILVMGQHLQLLSSLYTLAPIEEKDSLFDVNPFDP